MARGEGSGDQIGQLVAMTCVASSTMRWINAALRCGGSRSATCSDAARCVSDVT